MKRTINLYQDSLKPKKERLPFSKVLLLNGAAIGVMLVVVIALNITLGAKQKKLNEKTNAISQLNSEIKTLSAALEKKRDTQSLQQQLEKVNAKIENRKRLLAYLDSGELSFDATKYGEVMDDLANFHNQNLWLTSIDIDTQTIRLSGQTLAPSSIPVWLKKLQQSPFFQGKSFSSVQFDEVDGKENVKQFLISTDFEGDADESVPAAL
ncbi:MAG: PilN domain-containing protein [Pseudomonadota bacterium]|nr:PilN domain-containing protein [Pseudomonadota bacterium]